MPYNNVSFKLLEFEVYFTKQSTQTYKVTMYQLRTLWQVWLLTMIQFIHQMAIQSGLERCATQDI